MIPQERTVDACNRWILRNLNSGRSNLYDANFLCNYSRDNGWELVTPEILGYIAGAYFFADLAVKTYIEVYGTRQYDAYITSPIYGVPITSLGVGS